MKKLLFSLLLLASVRLEAQQFLLPLQSDSLHRYTWFYFGTDTLSYTGYTYPSYDADGRLSSELVVEPKDFSTDYFRYDYSYNGSDQILGFVAYKSSVSATGPWENYLKEDDQYDTQGREIYLLVQQGSLNTWVDDRQEFYWFDDAVNKDSSIVQYFDAANSVWQNNSKIITTRYPGGLIRTRDYYSWNYGDQFWEPNFSSKYTYFPDGKQKTTASTNFYGNGEYVVSVDSFLYRPDNNVDTIYTKSISYPSGEVVYEYSKTTYDNNGITSSIVHYQLNSGTGVWLPATRELYYPPDGVYSNDFSRITSETFNSTTQTFDIYWDYHETFTPLPANRVLRSKGYITNNAGVLSPSSLDSTWYSVGMVPVSSPETPGAECTFANPYKPGSPVICNAPEQNTPLQLQLYNMMGQPVLKTSAMPGEAWTLPPATLHSGMYVLEIWQNGRKLGSRKMLIP